MSSPAHAIGELLSGRFRLEAVLGRGAMGTVYRARDEATGATVAVKSLDLAVPSLLAAFKGEFREFADLRHRNLVRLGELFEAGGRVYYSMELVDGVDLLTWLRPGGQLDVGRVRDALPQLAAGLAALHGAGHVHRDLKPDNVLVDADGRLVILDFGLAARAGWGTRDDDAVVGTVEYMAPEQAAGEPLDARADWYAVGVMLCEALTGALPFAGAPADVLAAKRAEEATPAFPPGTPDDLVALCRQLLARRPAARPRPAELVGRLGGDGAAAAGAPPVFVGRRAELDALASALSDARHGPLLTLVVGESGLGKTALVEAFARPSARPAQLVTLDGRCHEREALPFKAFDGIADALARTLRRWPDADVAQALGPYPDLLGALFPALDQVPAIAAARTAATGGPVLDLAEQRRRAFAAFAGLLGRLAQRRPVLVVIDDLHRADPDSLDLLAELLRPGPGPAPLVLGTARAGDVVDRLVELGAAGEIVAPRIVRLAPLDDGPARELARLALARRRVDATAAQLAAIVADSHSHPGFLLELARADGGPTGSFDALLRDRVARLPPPRRALLEALAVAEAPLPLVVLAATVGREPAALRDDLDALRDAALITRTGRGDADVIEPYHDRVAEAVRERLTPDARIAVHRALAAALDGAGAIDPERVLSHYLAAGEPGPVHRLAIDAALRASASLQHRRCVRLCRLALAHDPGPADAERLHRVAADAQASLGAGPAAAEHYLATARLAAARGDVAADRDARRMAADQLLLGGEVARGVEVLDGVLTETGLGLARSTVAALTRLAWVRARRRWGARGLAADAPPLTAERRAELAACWTAALGLALVDTVRGAEYQARFVHLALASGDRALAVRGLAIDAGYAATLGAAEAAWRAALADAAALATTDVDRGWVDLGASVAALMTFAPDAAIAAGDRAVAAFAGRAEVGVWAQRNARLFAIRPRWWAGRLIELDALVRTAVTDARHAGDRYSLVQLLVGVGANAWLAADDLAGFWAGVDEARASWAAPTFQMPDYYRTQAEVRGHCYAGDGDAAWRAISEAWPAMDKALLLRAPFNRIDMLALRGAAAACAAATRAPAARAALHGELERTAAQLERHAFPYARGAAAALRGALAAQRGDPATARELVAAAAASYAAGGLAAFAAAAALQAATVADDGAARAAAAAALADEGVIAPTRFAAMLVPGVA